MQPQYSYLDVPEAVEGWFAGIEGEPAVAVDLEADSLHSYREKVCLVQVSTRGANAVLDPLACRDALAPLGRLLENPSVQKVVHGGDYDVRLLKKDFGLRPRNLFDTMIAAQFTGREQYGLAALLREHFGVVLDKRYQRADWSHRPLGPELLAYAALDTAYLLPLRDLLSEELRGLGRLRWVEEEFELLCAAEPGPPRRPWCLDVKGAGRLPPRQLAVLQALLELRDRAACERDRPPFKVLSNDLLLAWAASPPSSRREVLEAGGAPKPVLAALAEGILEGVRAAQGADPATWPRPSPAEYEPLTGAQERRLKRLKEARAGVATALGLPVGLLVNSATLERAARQEPPGARAALEASLKNWQREVLGPSLEAALGRA